MPKDGEGVKEPAVAQQEGTNEPQISKAEAFAHPEVKKRMGEISAAKNQWQSAATQLQQQFDQFKAEVAQELQQRAAQPEVDEDAQWTRTTVIEPILAEIDRRLDPILDKDIRNQFWAQYPNEQPEVKEEVEQMVASLKATGQGPVDRGYVRFLVLGKRADEKRQAEADFVEQAANRTQEVNQVAQVATGSTPKPPESEKFDELNADGMFKKLSEGGAFNEFLKSGGSN